MSVLAVWFPAVRTETGTDVFTERLAEKLSERGIRTEITWLPLRAEYAPWTVKVPGPPEWATVAHINTWLHPRFLPRHMPIVATIHHAVHHPAAKAYKGLVRTAYHHIWIAPNERYVLRRANRVVAVSCFVAETAKQVLLDVPTEVIYNGIDTNCYRPRGYPQRPEGPFRLLYVGSWMARKGVDLLAPIMRELGNGFELSYTGGNPAKSDKMGMPGNMRDIGRLRDDAAVVAAMRKADALLFPSRSEGFGLVAAEAMACGLPVIATRGSSLVEVVDDGVTGILCPQDDTMSFAVAARVLAEYSGSSRSMARAARARALDQFAIDSMVEAYIRTYGESTSR